MENKEMVVCAAVRKWAGNKEEVEIFVDYPDEYLTNNAQIGYVGYQNGFITNKNRFVDPKEAMKIAVEAKQIDDLKIRSLQIVMFKLLGQSTRALVNEKLLNNVIEEYLSRDLTLEDLY